MSVTVTMSNGNRPTYDEGVDLVVEDKHLFVRNQHNFTVAVFAPGIWSQASLD